MTHTVMGLWCQTDTHTSRHIHTNCSTGLRWLHMLLTRGSSVHLLNKSRRSCHRLCLAAAAAAASTGRGSLVQGALECVSDVSSTCTNADARWLCRCPRTRRARVPRPGARLCQGALMARLRVLRCDQMAWTEKSREKQRKARLRSLPWWKLRASRKPRQKSCSLIWCGTTRWYTVMRLGYSVMNL